MGPLRRGTPSRPTPEFSALLQSTRSNRASRLPGTSAGAQASNFCFGQVRWPWRGRRPSPSISLSGTPRHFPKRRRRDRAKVGAALSGFPGQPFGAAVELASANWSVARWSGPKAENPVGTGSDLWPGLATLSKVDELGSSHLIPGLHRQLQVLNAQAAVGNVHGMPVSHNVRPPHGRPVRQPEGPNHGREALPRNRAQRILLMARCTAFSPTHTEFLCCSGKSFAKNTKTRFYENDSEPGRAQYAGSQGDGDFLGSTSRSN